jgi:hypothetical protein
MTGRWIFPLGSSVSIPATQPAMSSGFRGKAHLGEGDETKVSKKGAAILRLELRDDLHGTLG